jgi:hypothetical protein
MRLIISRERSALTGELGAPAPLCKMESGALSILEKRWMKNIWPQDSAILFSADGGMWRVKKRGLAARVVEFEHFLFPQFESLSQRVVRFCLPLL